MIDKIINWVIENREWIFSGIGVTILIGIIGFIRKIITKDSNNKKIIRIEQKNEGQKATQIGIQNNYFGEKND